MPGHHLGETMNPILRRRESESPVVTLIHRRCDVMEAADLSLSGIITILVSHERSDPTRSLYQSVQVS